MNAKPLTLLALALSLTACGRLPGWKDRVAYNQETIKFWQDRLEDDTAKAAKGDNFAAWNIQRDKEKIAKAQASIAEELGYNWKQTLAEASSSGGYAASYSGGYGGGNTYGTPSPALYVRPTPGTRISNYGGGMWSSSQPAPSGGTTFCNGSYGTVFCY